MLLNPLAPLRLCNIVPRRQACRSVGRIDALHFVTHHIPSPRADLTIDSPLARAPPAAPFTSLTQHARLLIRKFARPPNFSPSLPFLSPIFPLLLSSSSCFHAHSRFDQLDRWIQLSPINYTLLIPPNLA